MDLRNGISLHNDRRMARMLVRSTRRARAAVVKLGILLTPLALGHTQCSSHQDIAMVYSSAGITPSGTRIVAVKEEGISVVPAGPRWHRQYLGSKCSIVTYTLDGSCIREDPLPSEGQTGGGRWALKCVTEDEALIAGDMEDPILVYSHRTGALEEYHVRSTVSVHEPLVLLSGKRVLTAVVGPDDQRMVVVWSLQDGTVQTVDSIPRAQHLAAGSFSDGASVVTVEVPDTSGIVVRVLMTATGTAATTDTLRNWTCWPEAFTYGRQGLLLWDGDNTLGRISALDSADAVQQFYHIPVEYARLTPSCADSTGTTIAMSDGDAKLYCGTLEADELRLAVLAIGRPWPGE